MSASQGLSAARRRRAGPPSTIAPTPTNNNINQSGQQPSGGNKQVSVQALLVQHERRLFEIEKQVPQALETINANIEILKEGYNSISSQHSGPSIISDEVETNEIMEAPKEVQNEVSRMDIKINTALAEALSAKNAANELTLRINDVDLREISSIVNEHRKLQQEHKESKRELAELRAMIEELKSDNNNGSESEITFGVSEGK